MALQPGGAVAPEKLPARWCSANQLQPPLHQQMEEREGFMMWLRGEFAAANAIIDALCHHLRAVGDPGEYDGVIGSIQQRRCNWNPILHMQQYFSVADVVYGLQQTGWRRQKEKAAAAGFEGNGRAGKDYRRGGRGHNFGGDVNGKDLGNGYAKSYSNGSEKSEGGDKAKVEEKVTESNGKPEADSTTTPQGSAQGTVAHAGDKVEVEGSLHVNESEIVREEKRNHQVSPKTFVATEIFEGKPINIAEGLQLYEDIFEYSEISKLATLANDLRAAGRRGELKGQAFVALKRPKKGHGRELIQMGVPIADTLPDDEAVSETYKDLKTEPIPELLQEHIERLITKNILNVKPDSTIIDFFNEGDYSQPNNWPQSYGRSVCVLFLTECEMSFSRVITSDHPGDYRGALQLSLSPGSMLVMQGRSVEFARHAISSLRKQRTLITFVKSQPKTIITTSGDFNRFPAAPASNRAPPPIRPPPPAAIHFVPVAPAGILPWPTGSPRPRLTVVPGTGVFLPPQGNSPNQSKENGVKKSNGGHMLVQECNGKTKKVEDNEG